MEVQRTRLAASRTLEEICVEKNLSVGAGCLPLMGRYEAGESAIVLLQRDIVHANNKIKKRNKPGLVRGRVLHDAQAAVS